MLPQTIFQAIPLEIPQAIPQAIPRTTQDVLILNIL